MPDLDTQIRSYFEATTRRVDTDELLAGGPPAALSKTRPRRSVRRGVVVAVAAAVLTIVALGFRVLLPASETPPITEPPPTATGEKLPVPLAAWSLRGDGDATIGKVDLDFVGDYTLTADGAAFDGISGKAVTRGPGPLDTTRSLTMSVWVSHHDQLAGISYVLSQVSEGEQVESVALGVSGDAWTFGTADIEVASRPVGADIFGTAAPRSDDWVLLTGVSDREAGVIRFYLNGNLVDEIPSPQPFPASGPLVIGDGWAGAVAGVSVYQAVLTADEIAQIYEATRPDAPPPRWTPDPATYADGILDGTWDYVLSDDVDQRVITQLQADYGPSFDEARIRLGFDGARWWQGFVINGELWLGDDGLAVGTGGLIKIDGDRFTVVGEFDETTYEWTLAGDDLRLTFVQRCTRETGTCISSSVVQATDPTVLRISEHTFTRSGDDPSF